MVVHNLPHAAAPFFNRVSEIAEITQRLTSADCRLLTLIGPGGIGKTRLAMQVAANCADQFDDGVYFVPLQALASSEFIVSTILNVVSFQSRPEGDLKQQLFQYLREKGLLLVLDNFEHLLEGADLLTELLAAAPDLKLLVTSREVLNLQEEWLYSVRGLPYPETEDDEEPEAYSAVQLFVERAQQIHADLSLADEQAAIIRICHLVEGMPLALELAAVWAKALRTDEIAVEIQRSLDFLSSPLRNVPQRHQSMQAVFEQTWQRLADEERRVFRALTVFSGGFRREAAEAVAGVSLRLLSDLADKSLLTREPDGRYQMHELLRQYAQKRLEALPEEAAHIYDLHAACYAHFLDERTDDLNGGRQREAALEIKADIDNIRAVWVWSVDHSRVGYIAQSEHALSLFYLFQSRLLEGAEAFEKAVQMLDNGDPQTEILLAETLCDLGTLYLFRGVIEQGKGAVERSWQLYTRHDVLPTLGRAADPRYLLGMVYSVMGNFSAAEQLGQDALRDHTLRGDQSNLIATCYLLTYVARAQGNYEAARHYAQQGYKYTLATGDQFFAPLFLQAWGMMSQLLGDIDDAKRRIQASYALRKEFGDPKGMADTLTSLGRIALLEGDNAEAKRCYEQARTLYGSLGNKGDLALSLEGIGNSARAMGNYGGARRYLREALQLTSNPVIPLTTSVFVGISELFLETGRRARGIELLTIVLHHPATDYETKDRAQRLLTHYRVKVEAAQPISATGDFEFVTKALLNELQVSEDKLLTHHASQVGEALSEPLSERELEILKLVAEERSNREIATQLLLTVGTVKWYLTSIYQKLGVPGRTLAVLRARQLNLLP